MPKLNQDPRESTIEKACCGIAKDLGFENIKLGQNGWPDRLFIGHGFHLFVEFKRKGRVPTELQKSKIDRLIRSGSTAVVMDDVESFEKWITEITLSVT